MYEKLLETLENHRKMRADRQAARRQLVDASACGHKGFDGISRILCG
jgi:hypothetical protein